MRAVNLLPRDAGRGGRQAPDLLAVVGAGVGLLVVAALAGGFLLETSKVASARRALAAAKAQLATTPLPPPAPKVLPTPTAVVAQTQPRLQAVSSALSQRIAWDRILREFSLVLPNDIQLDSLTLAQPASTAVGPPAASAASSPTGLQLTGVTYSYDGVARLLSRMALVPDLTAVTLSNTSRSQDERVQFTISAGVKGAPAPVTPVAPTGTTTTATTSGGGS
jgi:Tfp pilus assembly protein PilN